MNGVIDCNMAPTADRCDPELTGSRRLAVPAASGFPAPEGRSTDTPQKVATAQTRGVTYQCYGLAPVQVGPDTIAVLTAVRTDRLVRHGKCRCRGHNPSLWRDF